MSTRLKALLIGGDGRTHALYEHLKKSPLIEQVLVAGGNGGIPLKDTVHIPPHNRFADSHPYTGIFRLSHEEHIDLIVPSAEEHLVNGIVDTFAGWGIRAFGPLRAAARLEGSKAYCKQICSTYGIPTAPYAIVGDIESAYAALAAFGLPIVIKADGLCRGKGVKVAFTVDEAHDAIENALVKRVFGKAGSVLVMERFLRGKECSVIAICDGERAIFLPTARDYKRAEDNDRGDNTGGVGAFSPIPEFRGSDQRLLGEIERKIVLPLLSAMREEGTSYRGILYAGIMLTDEGPQLFEVNCRFGDPETQVTLPLLSADIAELMVQAVSRGGFAVEQNRILASRECAVCVTLMSAGYPGDFDIGFPIHGLEEAGEIPGVSVYHAGTLALPSGEVMTSGGRVLNVVGTAATLPEARALAYLGASHISFHGKTMRRDIAA